MFNPEEELIASAAAGMIAITKAKAFSSDRPKSKTHDYDKPFLRYPPPNPNPNPNPNPSNPNFSNPNANANRRLTLTYPSWVRQPKDMYLSSGGFSTCTDS